MCILIWEKYIFMYKSLFGILRNVLNYIYTNNKERSYFYKQICMKTLYLNIKKYLELKWLALNMIYVFLWKIKEK